MNSFYDFIKNIEDSLIKYIGLDESNNSLFNSQIFYDKKKLYDPLLIVKIPLSQELVDLVKRAVLQHY